MINKNSLSQCVGSVAQPKTSNRITSGLRNRAALINLIAASTTVAVLVMWLDAPIIKIIHAQLRPTLIAFFGDVSGIANANFFAISALSVYAASRVASVLPVPPRWQHFFKQAKDGSLLMLLTLLTGGLITLILKQVVARARPSMLLEFDQYGLATPFLGFPFNSFPSSHAFTAFAVACVLAHLIPRWRSTLLLLAALTSLCRVLTLEHFPSDVLASAFIAAWCTRFWTSRPVGCGVRNLL